MNSNQSGTGDAHVTTFGSNLLVFIKEGIQTHRKMEQLHCAAGFNRATVSYSIEHTLLGMKAPLGRFQNALRHILNSPWTSWTNCKNQKMCNIIEY